MQNKYLNNVSWSVFEQIFRLLSNFFISILLVRYLGVEDFGVYSYVITISTFYYVFSKFGLNDIVIKYLVEEQDKDNYLRILVSVIKVKLFLCLVLYFAIVIISYIFFEDKTIVFLVLISTVGVLFQSFDVVESHHTASVNIKPIAISKNIQLFFSLTLKLLLIYFEFELIYFVLLSSIEIIFLMFLYYFIFKHYNGFSLHYKIDFLIIKKILKQAWPIALASLAMMGYVRLDQIMIFNMLTPKDLGVYAAAAKISESWYFVPTIIAATFFPKVIAASTKSFDEYQHTIVKLVRLEIVIAFTFAMFITIFGDAIISHAYGYEFEDSSFILKTHIWAGIFIAISRVSIKWHINEGFQIHFLYKCIIGFLINSCLNYFFIPIYGIKGAAVSTVISMFIIECLYYSVMKYSRIFFRVIVKAIFVI
ncbi:flippase [Shewanella scandinavica]|uniref:Flippase n=1 Tax=Shewanella scandinavica TaxID=3063538 RepID=A0ABU3FV94_9GAMM|nr:flippase [Shewanella sp. SP2S1-2]MDT3278988.1 flippase [Shewanella sp. SP2S1-2]